MYASYKSPSLQRKKSTSNKPRTKSPGSQLTPKKKPEWSPYLTEDNKFALSKDEILRRKLTMISKHNMFNGELAVVDITGTKDLSKRHTKTKNMTGKNGPFSALDLISMSKIDACLEENEHLELDDYENDEDEDEDEDVMSRLDDNEETLLIDVSPEGTTAGIAREAFRSLSPGECPRTVSKFSSSVSKQQQHRQQQHQNVMDSDEDEEEEEGEGNSSDEDEDEEEEDEESGDDLESEDADVVAGLRLAKATLSSTKSKSKSKSAIATAATARRQASTAEDEDEDEDDEMEADKENIAPRQPTMINKLKRTEGTGLGYTSKQGLGEQRHKAKNRPVTMGGQWLGPEGRGRRVDFPSTYNHPSTTPTSTNPTSTRVLRTLSSTPTTSRHHRSASIGTINGHTLTLTTPTKTTTMPRGTTTTIGVATTATTNNNKYRKTLFPASPPPQRSYPHGTFPSSTMTIPSYTLARATTSQVSVPFSLARATSSPVSMPGSGSSPGLGTNKADPALVADHDLREISQQIVALHAELR